MIVLGVILLVLGFFLHISILWTLGLIVLIIVVVFFVLGARGHAVNRKAGVEGIPVSGNLAAALKNVAGMIESHSA